MGPLIRKGQPGGAVSCNGRRQGCLVSAGIRYIPSRCLRDTSEVTGRQFQKRGAEKWLGDTAVTDWGTVVSGSPPETKSTLTLVLKGVGEEWESPRGISNS